MALGLVMVYSASIASAELKMGSPSFFLKRQLLFVGLSLALMIFALNIHHELWGRLHLWILGGAVLLLLGVFIPGLSSSVKGAARWIVMGPLRFQPSEGIKLAWLIFLARHIAQRQPKAHEFKALWLKPLGLMSGITLLLLLQPDFGSTVICGFMMLSLIWIGGARWRHTLGLISLGLVLMALAIYLEPYRFRRLIIFLNPELDPTGVGYHINQSLISFGSGEWLGLGLGASRQKLLYLPEAHTDFIFSIIGEELGLLGALTVMLIYALFIWRGFHIAQEASSAFGGLLAFGLTLEIGFQAGINMAVAVAMAPTKGLTLPFVSYGGSSLITLGLAVGILLNISRGAPPPPWLHEPLPRLLNRIIP